MYLNIALVAARKLVGRRPWEELARAHWSTLADVRQAEFGQLASTLQERRHLMIPKEALRAFVPLLAYVWLCSPGEDARAASAPETYLRCYLEAFGNL